jgi:hypothetical protein
MHANFEIITLSGAYILYIYIYKYIDIGIYIHTCIYISIDINIYIHRYIYILEEDFLKTFEKVDRHRERGQSDVGDREPLRLRPALLQAQCTPPSAFMQSVLSHKARVSRHKALGIRHYGDREPLRLRP